VFVFNPHAPELEGPEVAFEIASPISSTLTYSPTHTVETFTQLRFHSDPPVDAHVPYLGPVGVLCCGAHEGS
jgi:hypothetical protein